MARPADRVPSSAAVKRERCTRGWNGWPCKKRTCSICSLTWARDWRRVLFENLKSLGVPVALSADLRSHAPPCVTQRRGLTSLRHS